MRAHYLEAVMPELVDANIHVDRTTALVPLDMTSEWRTHANIARSKNKLPWRLVTRSGFRISADRGNKFQNSGPGSLHATMY